jgi:hypothetical protein
MIVFVWVDGMDGIVGNDFLCGWVAVGPQVVETDRRLSEFLSNF